MIRRKFCHYLAAGAAGIIAAGMKKYSDSAEVSGHMRLQPAAAGITPKAQALHNKAIIIDGHNDSLIEHRARKESLDLAPDWPSYQVDLRRMRAGGLTAMNSMVGDDDLVEALELWSGLNENLEKHPKDFLLINTPDGILRAKREDKLGLIGQLESCTLLHSSLKILHVMHTLGVRVAGLTHGEGGGEHALQGARSPFGYCTPADRERERKEAAGLTDFGRQAIRELNRLGIVVDLAHANDAAFFQALGLTAKPVEFSHGGVFALAPHWRNLTDDQLKALAANGGVIGLAPLPSFIGQDLENQTVQRFVDHIEYVCELVGDGHVGFGADYDGMGRDTVAIIPSYADMPQLTQAMLDRGFSEETILKFWGGNFLRVMKEAHVG